MAHGRVPDPSAAPPCRAPGAARRAADPGRRRATWPGPVLAAADPLPDGYAPRSAVESPRPGGPRPAGRHRTGDPRPSLGPARGRRPAHPPPPRRRPDRRTVRSRGPATGPATGGSVRDRRDTQVSDVVPERGRGPDGDLALAAAQDLDLDPVLARELAADLDPTLTPDTGRPLRARSRGAARGPPQARQGPGARRADPRRPDPPPGRARRARAVRRSALLGFAAVSPYLGAADLVRNVLMAGWLCSWSGGPSGRAGSGPTTTSSSPTAGSSGCTASSTAARHDAADQGHRHGLRAAVLGRPSATAGSCWSPRARTRPCA